MKFNMILPLALALGLSACASTWDGVKDDASRNADKVETKLEKTGDSIERQWDRTKSGTQNRWNKTMDALKVD